MPDSQLLIGPLAIILVVLLRYTASLPSDWCVGRDPRLYYANPTDCSSYISCNGHKPYIHLCPPDLYFDINTNTCNYMYIAHCGTQGGGSYSANSLPTGGNVYKPHGYGQRKTKEVPRYERQTNPSPCQGQGCPMGKSAMTLDEKFKEFQKESGNIVDYVREYAASHDRNASKIAKTLKGHNRPFRFVQGFLGNQPLGYRLGQPAFKQLEFLKIAKERFGLTRQDVYSFTVRLRHFHDLIKPNRNRVGGDVDIMELTGDASMCPFPADQENDCDPTSKYRTIDGSCNNLKHPLWGRSMRPLKREVPPSYEDGIGEPRKFGVSGRPLKGAREVSLILFPDVPHLSFSINLMHMTFGQFLDHDFARTAMTKIKDMDSGSLVDVECGADGCDTSGIENEACLPIPIPEGDPDFSGFKKCLMFVRSQQVVNQDCSFGQREQLNQVTSYLDGSLIYGNFIKDAMALRNFSDPGRGRLNVSPNPNPYFKFLLPQRDFKDCRDFTPTQRCFLAGDTRVNEQVGLAAIHTVFHRYHNYLEERLHYLNPQWDGERLYQEARRIMAAIWQVIVYNEYLPPTLGPDLMVKFGLRLLPQGYFNGYDEHVNADVGNGFQTAAFRFGHSQITNAFPIGDQNFQITRELKFSQVFNRPKEIYNNRNPGGSGVDSVLLGQLILDAEDSDTFFAKEVSANLFSERPTKEPGTDLPALNTQRGREHGLPAYVIFRQWCGFGLANTFDDLAKDIPRKKLNRLKAAYENVQDIDIFTGGLFETPVNGGLVGPTFGCMIGQQFRNSRVGDRFWHERKDPVIGFTRAQLSSIRKMTFARILCDTMDNVETIQKFVMLQPFRIALEKFTESRAGDPYTLVSLYQGEMNEREPCYKLPNIDLTPFIERY